MSKISSIYDELRTLVGTQLSSHTELNNPYDITDDADTMFDKGWAVGLGPASNTQRQVGCNMSVARDFVVTITRRYFTPSRDIANRIAAEKLLFEDQLLVIKDIETNPSSSNIAKMVFIGDNGLEFLEGDRFGFIILQSTINVEYFEQL